MSYTTLRQAPYAIRENKPFTGNSLVGYIGYTYDSVPCPRCKGTDWYIVKSYSTIMHTECLNMGCGAWWYNRKKYSRTTSRHQTAIRIGKDIS